MKRIESRVERKLVPEELKIVEQALEVAKQKGLEFLKTFYTEGYDFSRFEEDFTKATTVTTYTREFDSEYERLVMGRSHLDGSPVAKTKTSYYYNIDHGETSPVTYKDIVPNGMAFIFDALIQHGKIIAMRLQYEEMIAAADVRDINNTVEPLIKFLKTSGIQQSDFESEPVKIDIRKKIEAVLGSDIPPEVLVTNPYQAFKLDKLNGAVKEIFGFDFLTTEQQSAINKTLTQPTLQKLESMILDKENSNEGFKRLTQTYGVIQEARGAVAKKYEAADTLGGQDAERFAVAAAKEIAAKTASNVLPAFVEESGERWEPEQQNEFFALGMS